eukprot:1539487-Amphidinium_carterae.1
MNERIERQVLKNSDVDTKVGVTAKTMLECAANLSQDGLYDDGCGSLWTHFALLPEAPHRKF